MIIDKLVWFLIVVHQLDVCQARSLLLGGYDAGVTVRLLTFDIFKIWT